MFFVVSVVVVLVFFETRTRYAAQVGLKLSATVLPQPPKYRCTPLRLTVKVILKRPQRNRAFHLLHLIHHIIGSKSYYVHFSNKKT